MTTTRKPDKHQREHLPDGIYEQVIDDHLAKVMHHEKETREFKEEKVDPEESAAILTQYVAKVLEQGLNEIKSNSRTGSKKDLTAMFEVQTNLCNSIIDLIRTNEKTTSAEPDPILIPPKQLLAAVSPPTKIGDNHQFPRPNSPLSQSSLFTGNTEIEPSLISEWKNEILSSNRIDFLVSFIRWSGIRQILPELIQFTDNPTNKLHIITTTYIGATEVKAIQELAKLPNTEVKISYDTNRTRLHAKAYMFMRKTGFGTAYIGSSNLSQVAMSEGLEWNLKITEYEDKSIFQKCRGTFETYWNDAEFYTYHPGEDLQKLKEAITRGRLGKKGNFSPFSSSSLLLPSASPTSSEPLESHFPSHINHFNIHPYSYQQEILDRLYVERHLYHKTKNLIVAATGTGKTIISAFDYKRYCQENPGQPNRLLFIAHRKEILDQAQDCFRSLLRDENFGELWVGGVQPRTSTPKHLFLSIQTFNAKDLETTFEPKYFDFIIVDEFHHAAADSYQILLTHFSPKILVGLTATPERMDGKSIVDQYFDGRIAAEIRLNEAINRQLLSPFHYFAVTDPINLQHMKWVRGGYDQKELEEMYTSGKNNLRRATAIWQAVQKYANDLEFVKGIGFCVGVKHAHFMADFFNKQGLRSVALDANSKKEFRDSIKNQLFNLEIHFVFVADLYNEGVDIPDVNTVLFLRPTESMTIFLQQLGRGLRLAENKDCLTVLDFVGNAHQNYRFTSKFRALLGPTHKSLKEEVESGFPDVPKGCYIQLEKVAQQYILENISQTLANVSNIVRMIANFKLECKKELTLQNFLEFNELSLHDIYKASKPSNQGWSQLCVKAHILKDISSKNPDCEILTKGIKRLCWMNSPRLLRFAHDLLCEIQIPENQMAQIWSRFSAEQNLMVGMLYYTIWTDSPHKLHYESYQDAFSTFRRNPIIFLEIIEVIEYLLNNITINSHPVKFEFPCPLDLHCCYTTDQILAAFGYYSETNKPRFSEGVKFLPDKKMDLLFITLNKAEKDYSPSTLYHDYSINESLFHWQSQSTTSDESNTGQRYLSSDGEENQIVLFVRKYKNEWGKTAPFYFLGPANYKEHEGSRPINIIWELETPIPAFLVKAAKKFTIS